MFSRLPGSIGAADILMGASTTIRTAFPNSRLETLQQINQHNHNHNRLPHNNHNHLSHGLQQFQQQQLHQLHQQQQQQQQLHQSHQLQHQYEQHEQQRDDDEYNDQNNHQTQQPQPQQQQQQQQQQHHHHHHQQYSPYHRIPATPISTTTENPLLSPAYELGGSVSANSAGATNSITATSIRNQLLPGDDNDDEWWSNAIEEDTFDSPLAFDASENGLWNGRFVPPPPRPPFLDESVAADGLTTCDLCTWAWQRNAYSLDGSIDTSGELGWAFTLIIVSILSALIGAIIMVIVLRCKRIKTTNGNGRSQPWWCRHNRNNRGSSGGGGRGGSSGGGVGDSGGVGGGGTNGRTSISIKHSADSIRRPTSNSGVWTWLGGSRRSSEGPDQIGPPSSSPAENHYTHMDDAYSPVGVSEALYAELDRESVRSANPSYQNTGYSQCADYNFQQNEQDIPMVVSSAPSSAYYSDLSVTAMPGGGVGPNNERAYEIVGLTVMSQPLPHWEMMGGSSGNGGSGCSSTSRSDSLNNSDGFTSQRRISRLAAINETSTTITAATTVPSDYV